MKVDPQTLATGYRTSKVVGSTVYNEFNQTVGTIDDLIVTPGGQTPYAVLSVGGFLGLGSKYVVVPFTSLKIVDKKMVLPGGSKEALEVASGIQVRELDDRSVGPPRRARAARTIRPDHAALSI